MKRNIRLGIVLLTTSLLMGCFRPIIYLQNSPKYPVDVFYDNQRPDRPFVPLKDLESKGETALEDNQIANRRMVGRGNNMQDKEVLLARMTMEAQKLGADAIVSVRYKYYTSRTDNGYIMTGLAVKYKREVE